MTQFTEYASVGREMAALVLFREGKIRLPASAGRSSVLDEWKRLVLTMDSGIRRNWSVAFACAKKWRSLSHNGENDSEMIISSSFRCWGKLPTVRSQMSAALLLKRQVCLIRSSLGEISSFYACRFARISTGASGARGRYV